MRHNDGVISDIIALSLIAASRARANAAGESYAGKYIPKLATYITQQAPVSSPLKLVGLALGDAWIAPAEQISVLASQAYYLNVIDEHQANQGSRPRLLLLLDRETIRCARSHDSLCSAKVGG